ncbi:MAG TPA: hypothetical protein VFV66_35060 [Nonomuraea sp.]|nr:hypothetical protein [Nonomuraea sp.]
MVIAVLLSGVLAALSPGYGHHRAELYVRVLSSARAWSEPWSRWRHFS